MRLLQEMSSQEREKLASTIGQFASRVVALPAEERESFIQDAVGRLRNLYRERYRDDAEALVEVENFVDRLETWTRQTVDLLESEDEA